MATNNDTLVAVLKEFGIFVIGGPNDDTNTVTKKQLLKMADEILGGRVIRNAWVYAYTSLGADAGTAAHMVEQEVMAYTNRKKPAETIEELLAEASRINQKISRLVLGDPRETITFKAGGGG